MQISQAYPTRVQSNQECFTKALLRMCVLRLISPLVKCHFSSCGSAIIRCEEFIKGAVCPCRPKNSLGGSINQLVEYGEVSHRADGRIFMSHRLVKM